MKKLQKWLRYWFAKKVVVHSVRYAPAEFIAHVTVNGKRHVRVVWSNRCQTATWGYIYRTADIPLAEVTHIRVYTWRWLVWLCRRMHWKVPYALLKIDVQ
jgi:hypothetical protein